MKKTYLLLLSVLILTAMLAGCGKKQESGTVYQVYMVNKEDTKVTSRDIVVSENDGEASIDLMMHELQTPPEEGTDRAAISEGMLVLWEQVADNTLVIDFSKEYNNLSPNAEVLTRAAIVRTLCQCKDVDFVSFRVMGEELLNRSGVAVGLMNAEQFVENNGSEINSYERVSLTLYFASEDGDKLVSQKEEKVYNSNISLEKLVMEQLIQRPNAAQGMQASIDPATKVISVTVKDGTCYVNLDDSFLNQVGNCMAETTVYSVVNSLTELTNVNKVQISVNGETDISYREKISLSQPFERNYEIME